MRKMKDSRVQWIGSIPSTWDTIRLKFLHDGMNTGEAIGKEFWSTNENDIPFYTAGMIPIKTSFTDFPEWKFTTNSDMLLARNGTPYVYVPIEHACYTDHIIRVQTKSHVNRRFVQYSLQQAISKAVVDTVSIATWSASLWNEQTIPWPANNVQEKIVSYLDRRCATIDALIANQQQQIEKLKQYKQAVITEAVTRGLDPNVQMKDSGVEWIGQVPEHWEIHRIAYLYEERKEPGADDLPLLQVSINTGVSDHEMAEDEQDRVFIRMEDKTKYKRVYPGDLTYNMMRAWQGAFGAVRVNGMVSPAYVVAKPRGNASIDTRYFEALLRTHSATEEMHRYSHGIMDFRLRLYWPEFRNIRVCLPPFEEQQRIAAFIDEKSAQIDALIAVKQQKADKLAQYKKSLIYEVVTGKREVLA